MPDARPAPAPQKGEIHAFGTCVDCICIRDVKESREDVGDIVDERLLLPIGVAY